MNLILLKKKTKKTSRWPLSGYCVHPINHTNPIPLSEGCTFWIKALSQPMASMRHSIRGDVEPVCQQVCVQLSVTAAQTIFNKLGKYFRKEASNSPRSQRQGEDEDTRSGLLATDLNYFQHALIVLNTAICYFGLYSSDDHKSKYELKATFKM